MHIYIPMFLQVGQMIKITKLGRNCLFSKTKKGKTLKSTVIVGATSQSFHLFRACAEELWGEV